MPTTVLLEQELKELLDELEINLVEELPGLTRDPAGTAAAPIRRALELVQRIGERRGVHYAPDAIQAALWQVAIDMLLEAAPPPDWADPDAMARRRDRLAEAARLAGEWMLELLVTPPGGPQDPLVESASDAIIALHRALVRYGHEAPLHRDGWEMAMRAVEDAQGAGIAALVMGSLEQLRALISQDMRAVGRHTDV